MSDAPERELARALEQGLRDGFAERGKTALHLAELLLDAVDEALPLAHGRGSAAGLELLAQRADVYGWDGPPGWAPGGILVAAHASLLRLLALSSASTLLDLPEDLQAGTLPSPALDAILAEMDARAASGSDFAGAQEEWLARLLRENASAAEPSFRTFFAGVSQSLRLALSLRAWREHARSGQLPADLESVVGAIGAWQPERWQALRHGVPAAWVRELCPAQPEAPPLSRLAHECDLALDLAGRLWTARGLSLTGFAALATLLFARTCSALALREELG